MINKKNLAFLLCHYKDCTPLQSLFAKITRTVSVCHSSESVGVCLMTCLSGTSHPSSEKYSDFIRDDLEQTLKLDSIKSSIPVMESTVQTVYSSETCFHSNTQFVCVCERVTPNLN